VPGACLQLGQLLQTRDRLDDAEPWLRKATEQDSADATALVALADLLVQRHQRDLGASTRAHGLQTRWASLMIAPSAAPFPLTPDALAEAEQLYRRAGEQDAPMARQNLGALLAATGRLDDAEACLRSVADAGDSQAAVTLTKLRVARDPGADIQALLTPAARAGNGEASFLLGMLAIGEGRFDQGEDHLRRAIAAGHPAATAILVLTLRHLDRTDDAERLLAETRARHDTAALQSLEAWQRTFELMDEDEEENEDEDEDSDESGSDAIHLADILADHRLINDPAWANKFIALLTAAADPGGDRDADTASERHRHGPHTNRRPPTR
jgi:tetratricopeptide (TPR) repeat protein